MGSLYIGSPLMVALADSKVHWRGAVPTCDTPEAPRLASDTVEAAGAAAMAAAHAAAAAEQRCVRLAEAAPQATDGIRRREIAGRDGSRDGSMRA